MSKSENKTLPTDESIGIFLASIEHKKRRLDAQKVYEWMREITGISGKMWGTSIIGFGKYHYKYASGREGDSMKIGLSPRKASLTIYITSGFDQFQDLLGKLGKYKTNVSCLYIKNSEDVNEEILKELIQKSYDYMTEKYG